MTHMETVIPWFMKSDAECIYDRQPPYETTGLTSKCHLF